MNLSFKVDRWLDARKGDEKTYTDAVCDNPTETIKTAPYKTPKTSDPEVSAKSRENSAKSQNTQKSQNTKKSMKILKYILKICLLMP